MVGYLENDSLTATQKLIAGCMSGLLSRVMTQPLEVVKLRAQLQLKAIPNPHRKWFKITRRVYREEGIRAFWYGHNIGQLHSVVSIACQFYTFEIATEMASQTAFSKKYVSLTNFLCGTVAGCITTVFSNPLDVVKTRQMISKRQYGDFMTSAKKVFQSGGVLAFYEGWTAALVMVGPTMGISFGVFNYLQPLLLAYVHDCEPDVNCHLAAGNTHRARSLALASAISGGAAGLISKSVTYPFDLAKKRLQIRSHKQDDSKTTSLTSNVMRCNNLVKCLTTTFQSEGFRGLFRGWKITVYKSILTSVVTFTSYELFCHSLREYEKDDDASNVGNKGDVEDRNNPHKPPLEDNVDNVKSKARGPPVDGNIDNTRNKSHKPPKSPLRLPTDNLRSMFHESYYEHSCLVANEQDVLYTDIRGQGCTQTIRRWWHNLFLLSYNDERCRMYYTSSQSMRQDRARQFRKFPDRIHPLSRFSNFWTAFMLIATCLDRALVHHNTNILFFQLPLPFFFVGMVLELFILIDLCISFKTGYIDQESRQIVLNKAKGRMRFASTKLFVHALGAIPLHSILILKYGWLAPCGRCKANKLVCCVKIVNLFGLIRFYDASSFLCKPRATYTLTYLFKFLRIGVVGMTTMLVCLSLKDTVNILVVIYTQEIRQGSYFDLIVRKKYGLEERPSSLFFLCTEISMICKSLLGYDSGMKDQVFYLDIVFGLFKCLIAAGFYMWSFIECFSVVFRRKYSEDQVMMHKEKTLNLLRCRQLSDRISQRVHAYYDFNMSTLRMFERQNDLYHFLPSSLHTDIRQASYLKYLKRMPEFKKWPYWMLEDLVMLFREEIFLESDVVANAWQPGEGLVILHVGVLAVYSSNNDEIGHLIDGDYFGELSLVTDKEIRTSSVVAITNCKILFLPKKSFRKFMRQNPTMFFEMRREIHEEHKQRGSSSINELVPPQSGSSAPAPALLRRN